MQNPLAALARILDPRESKAFVIERHSLADMPHFFEDGRVRSGVSVTERGSMRLVSVYSAVNLIAQSISSLPVKFMLTSDEAKVARKPQQYKALWSRPNPYQSRLAFWETMIASLLLWGNAYAKCVYNDRGDLIQLWPIGPERMSVKVDNDGTITFKIQQHGEEVNRPGERPSILFIPGLALPGAPIGLSPIMQAMEAVGLGIAVERTAAGFYGNGMNPAGLVRAKGELTPEAAKEIAAQLRGAYGGPDKAGKWAVIGGDTEMTPLMIPPQQAQFIEQQRYADSKIWALFRVPPHLVGDVSKSTSWGTGIEEQTIGFVTYTLMPWIRKCEEAISSHFLDATDFQIEFAVQALMRGSMEARYRSYAIGRAGGWLSPNMILRFEGLPPIGPDGDVFVTALNMQSLEQLAQPPAAMPPPPDNGAGDPPEDQAA